MSVTVVPSPSRSTREKEHSASSESISLQIDSNIVPDMFRRKPIEIFLPPTLRTRGVFLYRNMGSVSDGLFSAVTTDAGGNVIIVKTPTKNSDSIVERGELYPTLGHHFSPGHLILFIEGGDMIDLGSQIGSFTQWSEGAIQPIRDMLDDVQVARQLTPDELHDYRAKLGLHANRDNKKGLRDLTNRILAARLKPIIHDGHPLIDLNSWLRLHGVPSLNLPPDYKSPPLTRGFYPDEEHLPLLHRFVENTTANATDAGNTLTDVTTFLGGISNYYRSDTSYQPGMYFAICSRAPIPPEVLPYIGTYGASTKEGDRGNGIASVAVDALNKNMGLFVVSYDPEMKQPEIRRVYGAGSGNGCFMGDVLNACPVLRTDNTFDRVYARFEELKAFMKKGGYATAFILAGDKFGNPIDH